MTRGKQAARLRLLEEKARQRRADREEAAGLALRSGLTPEDLRGRLAAHGINCGEEENRARLEALPLPALLSMGEEAREALPDLQRQLTQALKKGKTWQKQGF